VGADALLDGAALFATVADAVADLHLVLATTARARGQMKRAIGPEEAMRESRTRIANAERVGILFGRERTGLENDAISLADAIVSFPANPAFASLNLAGAVLLIGYEWARATTAPAARPGHHGRPAERGEVVALFEHLEAELEAARYYPPNKRAIMSHNLRDRFLRMALSSQDVGALRGVIRALTRARTGATNATGRRDAPEP
jgi:tRNA/rRNA methyltransferase